MKKLTFALLALALIFCLLPALSQPAEAAIVVSKGIDIIPNGPSIGMAISDLTASVLKARLESIHVYDAYTEQEITEGCFEDTSVYYIHYVLKPYEGQTFAEKVGVSLNGTNYRYFESESETRAVYVQTFTACKDISKINLTVPVLEVGTKPAEVDISLPENANFHIESFGILDLQTNEEAVELRWDGSYELYATLLPNDGYRFYNTSAYCNGARMTTSHKNAGTYLECSIAFSLDVGEIPVYGLSKSTLEEGDNLNNNVIVTQYNDYVTETRGWWTDASKNSASGKAEGGKLYYLTFKISTIGPVGAWETPNVTRPGTEPIVDVIDGTTAIVYLPFTALYDTGNVDVLPQGIAAGKPISSVTAQLQGSVTLKSVTVMDENNQAVTKGVFEDGHIYTVRIQMNLLDGYCAGRTTKVTVNGESYSYTDATTYIYVNIKLDTRIEFESAKVNVSGVGIGKTISKVKITAPSGSKFEVYAYNWASTDTSSAKFKKGELYQVRVRLKADEAYRFTENTALTIGGKKALDISISDNGKTIYGTVQFSYLTEVTKVSLPAMPKSIKPGQTLPTKFKVSSSAKYTLEPVWLDMRTQETVTAAGESGCYVLAYVAVAKNGCEFTKDTVFYLDGKKVKPVVVTASYAEIMKPYNVGLTEVSRIDLTLPEPEHGAAPGEITLPADAPYALTNAAWGVNSTGKLADGGEDVTTFQNYKYHFLAIEFQTAEGYAFADKVPVYINGIKYAVLEEYNLGIAYQAAVSFGKLGEIAKLIAPEVKLSGNTLIWESVLNGEAYEIYRATSKSGKYTLVTTVTENTWTDAPEQGKSYYYKVKAIFTPDTTKNSSYSNVVSIAYKCDAPSITAEPGATGKPVISWEKISGAKKYTVYRATSETGKYSKLGTTTKLTYTDSKAKTGTQYFYKVIANASSSTYNSGYSNIASCNVICSSVTVTVKVDAATGKPSLSWKKVDGATGYRILRQLPGEEDFTVIKEQTAVAFTDTSAPIDTQCVYLVQVMGKTSALDSQMSKEISATSGIAKPVLKTSIDASGKPELRWQTVEGAVKYEIYRSTKSTKSYSLLTTVDTTGYTDESVAPGKTYYYKVIAIGAVSKSAESSYAKLSGKCATPTISVAVSEESGKPQLTWEKISGAKKYTVYRATSETGKYSKLGTTTKLTYTDSKATVGKTYYYKIVANASSSSYNSAYSNMESCLTICAKPVVKATTAASTGKPQLTWSKVTGAKEYWIFLEVNGQAQLLTTTTKLSFTDETAVPGETRRYAVWAVNADPLCNSAMAAATVTATCAQPKIKGAVGETGKPEITITAVEGATKYVVYRSTSKSKNYKAIDETESLTFTDTTAVKGKTYYYKVVAICEDSESAQSAYVKVKSK